MKTILLHGLDQTSSSWKNTGRLLWEKCGHFYAPTFLISLEDKEVCYQVLYLAFSRLYCKQISEPVNICEAIFRRYSRNTIWD